MGGSGFNTLSAETQAKVKKVVEDGRKDGLSNEVIMGAALIAGLMANDDCDCDCDTDCGCSGD